MSNKLKTTTIEWEMATFMGDNSEKEIIQVDVNGVQIRLGILSTGQKVNCPKTAIDGVNFMTDAQLVEAANKKAPAIAEA